MGVDIVEIDIQRTKYGQLIIMYDPTLDRRAKGKGKISERLWNHVKNLRLPIGNQFLIYEKNQH